MHRFFFLLLYLALSPHLASAQAQATTQRVVSLAPHLTELMYTVDAGSQLVGVTRYSDYPRQAQQLPIVGDAFALQLEAIEALHPTLILLWQSGTPERQRDAVKQLAKKIHARIYENEIRNVQGIADTLIALGKLTERAQQSQQEAARVMARWQKLQRTFAPAQVNALRVFYQVWSQPLMTFNGQNLVSQVIQACGGQQAMDGHAQLTPIVSREAILAFNPQVLIAGQLKDLEPWLAFKNLAAVQQHHLLTVDSTALTRMSTRFLDAAEDLCQQLAAIQTHRRPAQRAP